MNEKAYKLLALQLGVSNAKAKTLIDRGLVFVKDKKVGIARAELPGNTVFSVVEVSKPKVIFEDNDIIAIDKPASISSEDLLEFFKGCTLLHRLDQGTSGVILLTKNEEFRLKAIDEFRKERVYKEYIAVVNRLIPEEIIIDKKISTTKGHSAISKIDKDGKEAKTIITPLEIIGKKTKVKAVITTGRTHQIRVHLKSIDAPIIGDTKYGGIEHKRIMLHSHKIKLLGYEFVSKEPKEFLHI